MMKARYARGTRLIEQRERADEIGPHKIGWSVNRPVDVGLGCQMQHCVGALLGERFGQRGRVTDVAVDERVSVTAGYFVHRTLGRRVRQLVEVDDLVIGRVDEMTDHCGTDETPTPVTRTFIAISGRPGR